MGSSAARGDGTARSPTHPGSAEADRGAHLVEEVVALVEPCRWHRSASPEAASHADPRTTMRYDRACSLVGRHATYIVATFIGGAAR